MNPIWFLVGAVVLSIVGSVIVALIHREPKIEHGEVDEFAARMQALAPPRERRP